MEFDTPKGKMIFRKEDHQAMQSMSCSRSRRRHGMWDSAGPRSARFPLPRMPVPIRNKTVTADVQTAVLETHELTISFGGHVAVKR